MTNTNNMNLQNGQVSFGLRYRANQRALEAQLEPGDVTIETLGVAMGKVSPNLASPIQVAQILAEGISEGQNEVQILIDQRPESADDLGPLTTFSLAKMEALFQTKGWDEEQQTNFLTNMIHLVRRSNRGADMRPAELEQLRSLTKEELLDEFSNSISETAADASLDANGSQNLLHRIENIESAHGIETVDRPWTSDERTLIGAAALFMTFPEDMDAEETLTTARQCGHIAGASQTCHALMDTPEEGKESLLVTVAQWIGLIALFVLGIALMALITNFIADFFIGVLLKPLEFLLASEMGQILYILCGAGTFVLLPIAIGALGFLAYTGISTLRDRHRAKRQANLHTSFPLSHKSESDENARQTSVWVPSAVTSKPSTVRPL